MSHLVETMAWTNEVPWHGLGKQVPQGTSIEEMLKAAKLDWGVSLHPVQVAGNSDDIARYRALCRDSDGAVLDVVGSKFVPTQNAVAFEFFREFVEAGSAYLDTAGSLMNGRLVWGLARLGKGFKLAGNDKVDGYLLLVLPHHKGRSIMTRLTSVRVVCNNTLTMALSRDSASQFSMSHRMVFDNAAQAKAKTVMGIANDQFAAHTANIERLARCTISRDDALSFLATHLAPQGMPEGSNADRAAYALSDDAPKALWLASAALDKSPGADLKSAKGTLWGVVNAVTYMTDHLIGNNVDRRLTRAWVGPMANLKQRVFNDALKLAA